MPLIYQPASSPATATDEASSVLEHSELQFHHLIRLDSPNQSRFEKLESLMACYTRNAIALQSESAIKYTKIKNQYPLFTLSNKKLKIDL